MKFKHILPYLVYIALAFIILSPIFNEGVLTKSDSAVHVIEAEFLSDLLKEEKWINGWYPYEFAGIPTQMYYYQIPLLLVAGLHLLGIGIVLAYKILVVIALFLPAIVIFHLLKKHFGTVISFLVGLTFLFQSDLLKLSLAGMWANLIAFAIFILIFKKIIDYEFTITKKRAYVLTLLSALLLLAHPFFGIALAYLIILYFIFASKQQSLKKTIPLFAVFIGATILIVLFYLFPFIDTSSWLNPGSGWGLGDNLGKMLFNLVGIFFSLKPHQTAITLLSQGNLLFIKEGIKSIIQNIPMLLIDIFAVIGVIFYRKEIKFKKILKFTLYYTLISLIIGTGFWFLFDFGNTIPFLNGILAYRFVYYARLGLFIFAAYALYKIFDENIKQKWLQLMKIKKKYVITALLLILIIGFSLGTYFPPKSYTQTFPQAPIYKETQEVWNWLSENIQPNEVRILNQNFFDNIGEPSVTGDSIASALASKETGLFFFGSWYTTVYPIEKKAKTENKYLFGEKINTISDESIKTHMEIYNLKYAIAVSKELQERLEASNLFTIEKEFETYKIYILKEYTPSWIASEQLVEVQEFTLAEQTMDFTVDNPVNQQVIVKFAYHPYWKAFMDGVEIPLGTNEWYLMSLQLQEGIHQIHLEYAPKNTAVNIISLGAFIGVILLLLNNKRYKRKKEKGV